MLLTTGMSSMLWAWDPSIGLLPLPPSNSEVTYFHIYRYFACRKLKRHTDCIIVIICFNTYIFFLL